VRGRGYSPAVVLYTCAFGKSGGSLPAPIAHPCGRAAKALDDAGHGYAIEQVRGGTLKLWTWPSRARDRAEVEKLSGQRAVPILVLDDGDVVTGSQRIVDWAKAHPAHA
jgi:glutathione S-transferase